MTNYDIIVEGLERYAVKGDKIIAIAVPPWIINDLMQDPRVWGSLASKRVAPAGLDSGAAMNISELHIRGVPVHTRTCLDMNEIVFVNNATEMWGERNGFKIQPR